MTVCGAKTRRGTSCQRPAGWGTEHVGEGRCKLHGGATPIRHGRYSKVKREAIRSLIEGYEADPDPLSIYPELAAARALFQDFVERYDRWREALLAWHYSFTEGETPKPRQVLDLSDAVRHLEAIARIAQREKKLQLENAISRDQLLRLLTEQRRIVEAEVTDPETRKRLLDAFLRIPLA